MNEIYTPEQVHRIPSLEVARHLARVARLDLALEENHQTDGRHPSDSGSDDEQMLWYMDQVPESVLNRREHTYYDMAVLYSLAGRQLWEDLVDTHPEHSDPAKDYAGTHTTDLRHHLAFDGYDRVGGMFEHTEGRHVPTIGTFAAGALHRASIRSFVDRSLYDRRTKIEEARRAIEALAPERTMIAEYEILKPRGHKELRTEIGSIFRIEFNPRRSHDGSTEWWWDELRTDLEAIDQAAVSLA